MTKFTIPWFMAGLVGLAVCGLSQPALAFTEDDFTHFYSNYYRDPQPALANDALDYFVQNAASQESLAQKAGRERFFAVIAKTNPGVWRHADELFTKSEWPQKKILLEIFERSKDAALASSLTAWAQSETDDEHRLSIQKALAAGDDPLAILRKPLTDDNLDEQWACFFAAGDTRVITASFDQLSNTLNAYVLLSSGQKIKHLRQNISSLLAAHFAQPAVQEIFFQKAGELPKDQGTSLVGMAADTTLDLGDPALAQHMLPLVDQFIPNTPEQSYFHGGLAVLSQKWDEAEAIARQLEDQDGPWAECLHGFLAYHRLLHEQKSWNFSQAPAGGKDLLVACLHAASGLQSQRSFEVCSLNPATGDLKTMKLAAAYGGVNARFYYWVKSGLSEAWAVQSDRTFCWTSRARKWSLVGSRLSREQAETLTDPQTVAELLQQMPASLNRVTGANGEKMAEAVYRNVPVNGLVTHILSLYPGMDAKADASVIFDQESGKIKLLKMDLKLISGQTEKTGMQITRVYYDQNAADISWLEKAIR